MKAVWRLSFLYSVSLMLKLIPDKHWSTVQGTVPNEVASRLESFSAELVDQQYTLAGAILYDVFKIANSNDRADFFEGLLGGMEYVARTEGLTEEAILNMRSALWRSAHAFLVNNVEGIDRGKELNDLAKALKI